MLRIGDPAPTFRLESTAGREVSLEDFRGHKVVLYFYPKDETPGCTREACDFRDNMARLSEGGAVVLGVSPDSIDSHYGFKEHHDLPFDLLSDPSHELAELYGAYGEKISYGTPTMGIIRTTVVIDELGYVDAIWSPVTVDGHVDQVIDFVYGRTSSPAESNQPDNGATPAPKAPPMKKPAAKKPAAKPAPSEPKPAPAAKAPAAKAPAAKASTAKKSAKKATKKAAPKPAKKVAKKTAKSAAKKVAKKAAKKVAKKIAKKPVAKKAAKKTAKKAARPMMKKAGKKVAKKATKKATKKIAKKAKKR